MSNLIKLNKKFLSGGVDAGIEITPPFTEPDVVFALAGNTSFPFRQIDLGKISAYAEAGAQRIKFGDGAGQVVFKGSGSAFAGFGVYPDPDQLLAALAIEDHIAPGLQLGSDPNSLYVALRWGYDLTGSAKGSVALGAPGSITFGATGKREAVYAVIRRLDKNTGALTALEQTAQSWMLPSQIDRLEDLAPGTWLIAEVDGSVALSLGVRYGYSFNWVREAALQGLSGDIGLRLQMGVAAALSLSASGTFAIVISRDPRDPADKTIRFRLFRLRRKGWGFAFDAGASVHADFSKFLPEYDDFIKAVFGVHGAQVLKDLQRVEKWTSPSQTLGEILSGAGVKYGEDFLAEVTGIDPQSAFDQAQERLAGFLEAWNDLPHEVAAGVWKLVEKDVDLTEVRQLALTVRDGNIETVKKRISNRLAGVDFFATPEAGWLEAAAPNGVVTALNSTNEFDRLQDAARRTLKVLDGDQQQSVLTKLQNYVETHLKLESLFPGYATLKDIIGAGRLQDLDQASFDVLDMWLKARLAAFIDKRLDELTRGDINKIRQAIFLFMKKAESFYDKTLKALNRKYEFYFSYAYQSSATNTALLDLTLDFSGPGAVQALRFALSGKYDDLLTDQHLAVKLNLATLTHQLKRHAHVEINLPWSSSAIDHINESIANVEAIDNDDGRVFVYELDSRDLVEEKNKRQSRLAIGGFLKTQSNRVRVHDTNELTYAYTFRQVKENMRRADLLYQLKPYAQTYLGNVFAQGTSGTFDNWISSLDKQIDALEFNGTDNFGKTLIGLNLSLPASIASAWLSAPAKSEQGSKVPTYLNMSRRLQAKLKEILPFYYFQNLENYQHRLPAEVLLVYSAIPPSTYVRLEGNKLALNLDHDYYWDYGQPDTRKKMVLSAATRANLTIILERVHRLLLASGMTGPAEDYKPDRVEIIQNEVANEAGQVAGRLWSLLFVEAAIVRAAREAAYDVAKFTDLNNTKPSEAVKALARFGSQLTSAFNEKIKSLYGGNALRPLGTALFVEAASVLDPGLAVDVLAVLDLIVLKKEATFQLPKYLKGRIPNRNDVLVQERVLNIR